MTRIFEVSPYYISSGIIILASPLVLLLVLLLLLPKPKKVKLWELIKVLAHYLIGLTLLVVFLIYCHISNYKKVYVAYQNGEYDVVSGVMEGCNRERTKEHVWFTVDGVYFFCSDNGWAGHPPYELAKTFYNGMPVRIGYIEISAKQREIVFIDLLE